MRVEHPMTFKEVAKTTGLTLNQVRQIVRGGFCHNAQLRIGIETELTPKEVYTIAIIQKLREWDFISQQQLNKIQPELNAAIDRLWENPENYLAILRLKGYQHYLRVVVSPDILSVICRRQSTVLAIVKEQ